MMTIFLCYIATLFSQIAIIYFFGKLCHVKPKKISIKSLIVISIATAIQVYLNLMGYRNLVYKIIAPIFTITYFWILFSKIYSCSKAQVQNYSIIIWIISFLFDILVMLVVNMFNLIQFYESNVHISKSIGSLTMSILLILVANIPGNIRLLNKLCKKMSKINISGIYIVGLIFLYIFIAISSLRYIENRFIILLFLIIGFSLLVILITFISQQYQIVVLKKTNEIIEENNQINIKIINQYRILKHNLESQLLGVKTVSNKKAKELIDNLILEYNSSFYIKHDINSMPSGINGLIYEKLYSYKDDNINLTINNKIKSKILPAVGARSYNLFCEALGVTLDNALDASKKSKDKIIYLEFRENKDKIIFKIMNTFKGKIDLDKLGTINYTSKASGHGLGLFSLIGRKNLTITTSIKNNLFINSIEVNKEKK